MHFEGASCVPEENEEGEKSGEKVVATLSLSVQLPVVDGTTEEKGWREQSSMSRLLEKLRRAAEVFADPKVENELSGDEKGVKAKREWFGKWSQFSRNRTGRPGNRR